MEETNMMKKSQVALAKGQDIQANVTRVFDLMGGVTNVIRKGSACPAFGFKTTIEPLRITLVTPPIKSKTLVTFA